MKGDTTALRSAARRALPVLQLGLRRLARRKSPFQMTLSLTNRCNFRCGYCDIPLQRIAEMAPAEWCAAVDELCEAGMGRASLIGGEPLLYKGFGEVLGHLKRRGVHASMNTNGWLVPDRLDDLAGLDLACVTLDGPEAVHDRQRHPGSYARALRAIEALRGRGVAVVTMTVVTAAGVDHVDHVLAVARAHGVRAWFQLEHDARMEVSLPIAPGLSHGRVADFARHLLDRKRQGQPVGNSAAALEAQAAGRHLLACDSCWAGTYYGYVFSDGTVSHCLFTRAQAEVGGGRAGGFGRAFAALGPPRGLGCSCVPSYEVNRLLDLDPRLLFSALDLALRRGRP
jgi:MoaA/NifB/PqqE/SkfB family radical SAM enzyme